MSDAAGFRVATTYEPVLLMAVLLPPQTRLEDKFGGLPWGLPVELWPICANCGQPQSLIAQLQHDSNRLNLGRDGRVLHIFQCADFHNTGCDPWDPRMGASACFIVDQADLTSGLTQPPGPIGRMDDPWAWHGHPAARVVQWVKSKDTLAEQYFDVYFHPEHWYRMPFEAKDGIASGTKFGGIPRWGNCGSADHLPKPWRFVLQITDDHGFEGDLPAGLADLKDESGQPLAKHIGLRTDGGGWYCNWANFASGIGHVYVDLSNPPKARFTWQRW